MESTMQARARRFLDSQPGGDSTSGNNIMHRLAHDCIAGTCSSEQLALLSRHLDYRENAMAVTSSLLEPMGLAPFEPWWMWDYHQYRPLSRELWGHGFRRIIDAKLIPEPGPDGDRFYVEAVYYMNAAMQAQGLDGKAIEARVRRGRAWLDGRRELTPALPLRIARGLRPGSSGWMGPLARAA
ncbi:MAG: hypothetical protein M1832_002447 [Thelocarpon impressellum]|nr:MAG: hypothetical protein M1832_002447 [Thelocarpon impressellum]